MLSNIFFWYKEQAMNYWIENHFRKSGRPKCLILIGPTGTAKKKIFLRNVIMLIIQTNIGKTTSALSLFGVPNHYRGYWSPKDWNSNADYMIIDDIPWDTFEKERRFPDRRDLLTGQDGLYVCCLRSRRESRI